MIVNHMRRKGVHLFVAFASTGLISAAPVQADIPKNVIQAVENAQDPVCLRCRYSQLFLRSMRSPPRRRLISARARRAITATSLPATAPPAASASTRARSTAAHRTLPLGSKVRVTNQANGKSVIVRINDRGPFVKSRLIDVSYAAAQQISMIRSGHARVRLERIA
jgi:hypothetical protein